MISLRKSYLTAILLGAMAVATTVATSAVAEERTFATPKVGSQALDLCLSWGADCGKPAADAWCATKGYTQSSDHVVAHNIGGSTPTRLLSTGAVCDQPFCDGFAEVTCFRPDPVEHVYMQPMYNGSRLDLCVNWGEGCGAAAAKKFCQAEGWATASEYTVAHNIGASTPTRLIGTGAVCDQGFCDGFEAITCKN
jgi:hypothetical protein